MKNSVSVIFMVCCSFALSAQTSEIKFTKLEIKNRQFQPHINSIFRDSKGYLWLGSYTLGVFQYDGYDFKLYQKKNGDSTKISDNTTFSITEDSDGAVWFATYSGLNKFDRATGAFCQYYQNRDDKLYYNKNFFVRSQFDAKGTLWLKEVGNGLFYLGAQQNTVQPFHMDPAQDLTNEQVINFIIDKNGSLWYSGMKDKKSILVSYSHKTKQYKTYAHNPQDSQSILASSISRMFEDSRGNLWLGTTEGISTIDPATGKCVHYKGDLTSSFNVLSLAEDDLGRIWVGSIGQGLHVLDLTIGKLTKIESGVNDRGKIKTNNILSIYNDGVGTMWVGTDEGLYAHTYNDKKFHNYLYSATDDIYLTYKIIDVNIDDKGIIWFATNKGLYKYNKKDEPELVITGEIGEFEIDDRGNFWIGGRHFFLKYDPNTKRITKFSSSPDNPDSLRNDDVWTVYMDHEYVWVGTGGGGLHAIDKNSGKIVKHYKHEENDLNSLSKNEIGPVHRGGDVVWVAPYKGGVNSIDLNTGKVTHFNLIPGNPQVPSTDLVSNILVDKKKRVWVTTLTHIYILSDNGKHFVNFAETALGEVMINSKSLSSDSFGNIWFSTSTGLTKVDPETSTVRHYDHRDGFQVNPFSTSRSSKDGTIAYFGENGITLFKPEEIKHNNRVPTVCISDFQIFNKSVTPRRDGPLKEVVSETKEIVLSYRESFFSFKFAAHNLIIPEKNQYAYMLEGFEPGWNYTGTRRDAYYTNVPPGEYIFRVKASNNDGIWNEEGTSVKVIITPPFWQTWWFRSLSAMALLGSFGAFYVVRIGVVKKQRKELEIQIKERTKQLALSMEEERKARLEADKANIAKSVFLATMSHEIRTPMNGVIGMAELLAETPLNDEQKDYTDTIRNSGEALLGVINDILDYSKIESGKMELEEIDFDLRKCIENVLDVFAAKAAKLKIDLAYQIDHDVPSQLIGDSLRLRQILLNLVSNAIKFTSQGEIFIGVKRLRSKEDKAVRLEFMVRDTGIGISEDKLDRLFKAFSQVDSSTTRKYGGTGLGLIISERLVTLMNGSIDVNSREGIGTTFVFDVKLKSSQASLVAYANLNTKVVEAKRVLVIDDNETNRKILKVQLEQWKLLPTLVSSGKQALTHLSEGKQFDLIITDMEMPEMDGIALAIEIRKQLPSIPLVLLSSVGDDRPRQSALFSSILTKPIKQHILLTHILAQFQHTASASISERDNQRKLSEEFAVQHPFKILIAEDNLVNLKLTDRVLTKLGYKPDAVANGLEALRTIQLHDYDLILMDVQMPEMDGLEATRQIRMLQKTQPLIIAMTANAMQGDREDCLRAGMNDYISKPVKLEELTTQLRKWSAKNKVA